jgi:hypothetical protein
MCLIEKMVMEGVQDFAHGHGVSGVASARGVEMATDMLGMSRRVRGARLDGRLV